MSNAMPNPGPDPARAARAELARRGLPYSEESFLRQVRSGNDAIVALYLSAGISPDAALDGETALSTAARHGHPAVFQRLLKAGADPSQLIDSLKTGKSRKDWWEKLTSLSGVFTFVSSLVVASIGWYFTNSYNQRQLEWQQAQSRQEQQNKEYQNRLAEMQTVEKMIPHLTKDEASKKAALIAIGALATPQLASQMAQAYGGQGSIDALKALATGQGSQTDATAVAALTDIARQERGQDLRPAHVALAQVLANKEKSVVRLLVAGKALCNGFIVDGRRNWIVLPAYCTELQSGAERRVQLSNDAVFPISRSVRSADGLLAFIQIPQAGFPELPLRKGKSYELIGNTVTQLAYDLIDSKLSARLGLVQAVVASVKVPTAAGSVPTSILEVAFSSKEREQPKGGAGGPLFDSQGQVACMTYAGSPDGSKEQCLSADVIAKAAETLLK